MKETYRYSTSSETEFCSSPSYLDKEASLNEAQSPETQSQAEQSFYTIAIQYLNSRDYALALKHSEEELSLQPESLAGLIIKAEALIGLKRLEEANTICDKILELDSNNIEALLNKGLILASFYHKYDDAKNYFNLASKLYPTIGKVFTYKAHFCYLLGNFEKSIKLLDQSIASSIPDNKAIFFKGYVYSVTRQHENAIQCFENYLKLHPDDIHALLEKAYNLEILNNVEAAILCYKEITSIDSTCYIAWKKQANHALIINDPQRALNLLNKCLELHDQDSEIYSALALTFSKMGDTKQALEHGYKALEMPNYSSFIAELVLAQIYLDHEHARYALLSLPAMHPQDNYYYKYCEIAATAHMNLGEYYYAIKYIDHAIGINPNSCHLWLSKAVALYNLFNYKEALESINKALELKPGWIEALETQKFCQARLDIYNEPNPFFSIDTYNPSAYESINDSETLYNEAQWKMHLVAINGWEEE